MIYSVYWGGITTATQIRVNGWNAAQFPGIAVGTLVTCNPLEEFAKFIKEGEDDTFCFILTKYTAAQVGGGAGYKSMKESFDEWVEEYGLEEYIVVRSKGITNPIHSNYKHNLELVVMQTLKHFARVGQLNKEVCDAV